MRKNQWSRWLTGLACLLCLAPAFAAKSVLPKGMKLPPGVQVPNDTAVAIYLPANELNWRFYVSTVGAWAYPGKSLDDARREVGGGMFPGMLPVVQGEDGSFAEGKYGLLLAMDPNWDFAAGSLNLTVKYKVYDAAGKMLREGTRVASANLNAQGTMGGFPNNAMRAQQLVLADLLVELAPSAAKYPATADMKDINRDWLVDRSKPTTTGTAFYINETGQMLTAAHVLRDCLVLEAQKEELRLPVKLVAMSRLLDLAVVESGQPTKQALPLRTGQTLTLGESVTNVGYPLQGLLAASPNLTRGNVSARAGMKGSAGLFQFSAPIQPGSSGGPVVSDGGELLGITVSSLNAAALIKDGLLPQNVNFALDARYAAMFLKDVNVKFTEVKPRTPGSMEVANTAALGSVLQLSCYQ